MEQEPIAILELIKLIIFLGSVTFLMGILFQTYFLFKNRKSFWNGIAVLFITRALTIGSSFFIWIFWPFSADIMFSFIFLPAIVPELVLSVMVLKIFGNRIFIRKQQ